jgi:hypothetical protein
LNLTNFLNLLKTGLPAYIVLNDGSVSKITILNTDENNLLFEILTTRPGIQDKNLEKMIFFYKKILNLDSFGQFFSHNYQKSF